MFLYPITTFPLYELAWYFFPLLLQMILFGIYSALFCVCVFVLYNRETQNRKILMATTVFMFCLAAAQAIVNILHVFSKNFTVLWPVIQDLLYVITNVIADGLFIYRCYIVWGLDKYIIIVPTALLLATTGVGLATIWFSAGVPLGSLPVHGLTQIHDARTFFFISVATNGTLTLLTAGRIWWISRDVRATFEGKIAQKYNTAIAIILESGSIYCISVTAYLVCMSVGTNPPDNYDTDKYLVIPNLKGNIAFAALTQIVGIVPTLIIVRVCLGVTAETTIGNASEIYFRHREGEFVAVRRDSSDLPINNAQITNHEPESPQNDKHVLPT